MANRRFAVYDIRNIIVRMRLGESDRQLRKAGVIGRHKASALRQLARELGWLDTDKPLPDNSVIAALALPRQIKARQESLVEPFAERVKAWSERGVSAVAIHQALVRDHGFSGGYDSVKRFLRRHREPKAATIILDFAPGEAAQVDFGTGPALVDAATGEVRKTWFFVMTLAFSRHQYIEFVVDQKVETWVGCHRRAFEFFGGVPARVIIDNPKCAITRACYHDPEVNRAYHECAEGYGFVISPCPVADPAKKGIVESGVKYVKRNFLPLREFRDLVDLNRQARAWVLETAGNRVHGTTRERPLTRFSEVEKDFLGRLPDMAPEVASWTRVTLHDDCHVRFENRRYSAPFGLAGRQLWLRATETTVQLFQDMTLVAVHPRILEPGGRSTLADHLPPEAQAWLRADPGWCLERAGEVGASCRELVETLLTNRTLDRLRAAQGVIRLAESFGARRLEAACGRALAHGTPTYGTVKGILGKGLDQEPAPSVLRLDEVYSGKGRFIRSPRIVQ